MLVEAQRRSLTGNLPFALQKAHSEELLQALLMEAVDGPVLQLRIGGGLPGLVLAVEATRASSRPDRFRAPLPPTS